MKTAVSILNSFDFKQLRPGENDSDFKFAGPGIVVIACEPSDRAGSEVRFSLLTALSADNDALEVAARLLKQNWKCDGYVFALLAPVSDRGTRLEAVAALDRMCSAGT